jgi:hypothetical protein
MPKEREISQIRDFIVDFRLNDEGDLELAEFGESCRDAFLGGPERTRGEPEPERCVSKAESPQIAVAPQEPRSSAETKGGTGSSKDEMTLWLSCRTT